MTEGTCTHQTLHKGVLLQLLRNIGNARMVHIERYEPITDLLKERKALHLRETTEIDVGTLFLHLLHPLETFLQLFHPPFFLIGMKDVIQRMFLHFLDTITCHAKTIVLQQIGHNLPLDGLVVLLSIYTQDNLMLQLYEFLTHRLVG